MRGERRQHGPVARSAPSGGCAPDSESHQALCCVACFWPPPCRSSPSETFPKSRRIMSKPSGSSPSAFGAPPGGSPPPPAPAPDSDEPSSHFLRGSHFMRYVLNHASDQDKLRKHFFKPDPHQKPNIDQPVKKLESGSYHGERGPEELKRPKLLQHAENYYQENKHGSGYPSVMLTNILVVVFFIPAAVMYFTLRLVRTLDCLSFHIQMKS